MATPKPLGDFGTGSMVPKHQATKKNFEGLYVCSGFNLLSWNLTIREGECRDTNVSLESQSSKLVHENQNISLLNYFCSQSNPQLWHLYGQKLSPKIIEEDKDN